MDNFLKMDMPGSGNNFSGYDLSFWNLGLTWMGKKHSEHISEPSEFLRLIFLLE